MSFLVEPWNLRSQARSLKTLKPKMGLGPFSRISCLLYVGFSRQPTLLTSAA